MKNTIKKTLSIVIAILMIVSTVPMAFAAESDVVILYTNDVHCTVDNYAVLAAYKAELIANGHTVITVDAGDAIQNDDFCSMTAGETVVDIMNAVGYDYAVPGNHEFDYGVDVFLDLAGTKANYNYISSNFYYLTSLQPVFEPYYIEDVGDYQIAFVGISTPETANASPEYFKNESGNFIYGFPVYPGGMTNEILYETIQESVDDAINDGADIVVAVGHTGITETTDGWKTSDIIANTSGIDYFIDGHSHETVEEELYQNINEEDVVRTSTGSDFANFGVMTIHGDGSVDFELIDPNTVNVDEMSADAKTAYNTVKEKVDDFNDNIDDFGHDFVDGICGTCGEVCTHIDTDYDEICDDCGAETPIKSVELNIWDTVYIPEEHAKVMVKFIPEESGEYVIISDNGGDDENIDPYVSIYDSDDEIASDDDNDYVDTYNFYCIFEAEAGETYYIELSCYDGDVEYDYTIEKHLDISHQPTASEPYVELNWDVEADYQWYLAEEEMVEITDENADSCSYYGEPTVYDEETGWSGDFWDDYGASFFGIELEEGNVILVDFGEEINDEIGIWDYDRDDGFYVNDGTDTDGTIELTAPWDGYFELYAYGITRETTVKAYMDGYEYTAINGETDATLENPEIGEKYACKVILEDGTVLTSDVLEYTYAITHQPTTDEPYVGLNDDTDATYQWYSVVDSTVEITDENADTVTYDWGTSSYNAETGWSGVPYGENFDGQDFFTVSLEEGDTITVELTGDYYSGVGLWDYNADEGVWVDSTDATSYELTVEWDGDYTFYTYQEEDGATVYVKAYIDGYEYTPINGETDSVYAPTEEGLYACEVTFADDTTEMSDVFEGPHAHDDSDDDAYCDGCDELLDPSVECDHNCHKGGIKGFFWKITRFFNKLFGTNKYCECGVAHY